MIAVQLVLLASLLLLCSISNTVEAGTGFPPQELDALYALYISAHGVNWNWKLSGTWNFNQSNPNPCSQRWLGIVCLNSIICSETIPCNVQNLNLPSMNLVGSIPPQLGNLTQLQNLFLSSNKLTGTIPPELGNCSQLYTLDLSYNQLNGSIPYTISNWKVNGNNINLMNNQLSGSIPITIGGMRSLQYVIVANNHLTGSIPPSICNTGVFQIVASNNHLNGSINSLSKCTNIASIVLDHNQFSGTIPYSFFYGKNVLKQFMVNNNNMWGTVPTLFKFGVNYLTHFILSNNQFTGRFLSMNSDFWKRTKLVYVMLDNNSFSGSISPWIGNLTKLSILNISNNDYTGTVPNSLHQCSNLSIVNFANNQLRGSIGDTFSHSANLTYLNLDNNSFTGAISNIIDYTVQHKVRGIDIGMNSFSGEIEETIFLLPELTSFVAAVNCLSLTISNNVCFASQLKSLILDGLQTSEKCRKYIVNNALGSSYYIDTSSTSTIPSCVLTLPKLQTLHLSGNGFRGGINVDKIGSNLLDISLSHNKLSGTIPTQLIAVHFENIDISFNFFSGKLPENNIRSNVSFSAQVNRLSGTVPTTYTKIGDVSILNGNMFSCDLFSVGGSLPRDDPYFDSYECGSSFTYYSFIVWTLLFLIVLLIAAGFRERGYLISLINLLGEFGDNRDDVKNIQVFVSSLKTLQKLLLLLMLYSLIVLMPIYGTLTVYYGTFSNQYFWTVSAAFLSGLSPAVILLTFLIILLALCIGVLKLFANCPKTKEINWNEWSSYCNWVNVKIVIIFSALIFLNGAVVVAVNGVFVYAISQKISTQYLQLLSVGLAVFKFLWSSVVVMYLMKNYLGRAIKKLNPGMYPKSSRLLEQVLLNTLIGISIFNSILAPYLAAALVSTDCFVYVITSAPSVTSYYDTASAVAVTGSSYTQPVIISLQLLQSSVSYEPPFIYSYQCSSALLSDFVYVFVYRYILSGIIHPLFSLILLNLPLRFRNNCCVNGLLWMCVSTNWKTVKNPSAFIPSCINDDQETTPSTDPLLTSGNNENDDTEKQAKDNFTGNDLLVKIIVDISVSLTFGVLFPPLMIIVIVSMVVDMASVQILIVQIVQLSHEHIQLKILVNALNKSFMNFGTMLHGYLFWILQLSAIFWSFTLFDTLGDEVGAVKAIWIVCVMCTAPLWLIAMQWCVNSIFGDEKKMLYKPSNVGIEVGNSLQDVQFLLETIRD